ncbi:hypothetical protein [Pandoraea anhela]|uniref:hypothetical protein n=1 Tax=Pandoraea anhela TaxID=2508295 RepID=UPI0012404640|nr:hypothetical protein [Pandoraea anhela]
MLTPWGGLTEVREAYAIRRAQRWDADMPSATGQPLRRLRSANAASSERTGSAVQAPRCRQTYSRGGVMAAASCDVVPAGPHTAASAQTPILDAALQSGAWSLGAMLGRRRWDMAVGTSAGFAALSLFTFGYLRSQTLRGALRGTVKGPSCVASNEARRAAPVGARRPRGVAADNDRRSDACVATGGNAAHATPACPTPVDLRDTLDLDQVLTLSAWVDWDVTPTSFYALGTRAEKYSGETASSVLSDYVSTHGGPAGDAPWDAPVNVTYQESGHFYQSHGLSVGLRVTRAFTLMQIAFGHHYLLESLKMGFTKVVCNVDTNDPAVKPFLKIVDSDTFRNALHARDLATLQALRDDRAAAAAHAMYVSASVSTILLRALAQGVTISVGKDSASPRDRLDQIARAELNLVTYRGDVVAGLVAIRDTQSDRALLISVKRGVCLAWNSAVELSETFRDFVLEHLPMRSVLKVKGFLRWNDVQFRFASPRAAQRGRQFVSEVSHDLPAKPTPLLFVEPPSIQAVRLPQHANHGQHGVSTLTIMQSGYYGGTYVPELAFVSRENVSTALWRAELSTMRSNLDLQVVTAQVRRARDWGQLTTAMLQSAMIAFPILGGALKDTIPLLASNAFFRAGATALSIGHVVADTQAEQHATLTELRRMHERIKLSAALLLVNHLPGGTELSKIVRAMLGYGTSAASVLLKRLEPIADPIATHEGARMSFVQKAQALKSLSAASATQDTPWRVIDGIRREALGASDATVSMPGDDGRHDVRNFLGAACLPVKTLAQLRQLPPGYAIAFVYRGQEGQEGQEKQVGRGERRDRRPAAAGMFYAGVTCGKGVIVGRSTDQDILLLGTERFESLDFYGAHEDLLDFAANGTVSCEGTALDIFVDASLRKRLPALPEGIEVPALRKLAPDLAKGVGGVSEGTVSPQRPGRPGKPGKPERPQGAEMQAMLEMPGRDPWHAARARAEQAWDEASAPWRLKRWGEWPGVVREDATGVTTDADADVTLPRASLGATPEPSIPPTPPTPPMPPVMTSMPSGTSTATPNVTMPLPQVPALGSAIDAHWELAPFQSALRSTLQAIETGLLLWYLRTQGHVSAMLIVKRLTGNLTPSSVQTFGVSVPGVVALTDGRDMFVLSLRTGQAQSWSHDERYRNPAAMREFLLTHLNQADANDLWDLLHDGLKPSDPSLSLVACRLFDGDWRKAVARSLYDWFSGEASCLSGNRQVGRVLKCRTPDRTDDDMIYLVGLSARMLDEDVGYELMQDVRHVLNPADLPPSAQTVRRRDSAIRGQSPPTLMFAHYFGASVQAYDRCAFRRSALHAAPDEAKKTASAWLAPIRARFASYVTHGDIADMLDTGVGHTAFGNALRRMGAFNDFGAFGVVEAMVREHEHEHGSARFGEGAPSRPAMVEITHQDAIETVAPGYPLLVLSKGVGENAHTVRCDLMSTGGGFAVGWLVSGNGDPIDWSMAYKRYDLSRDGPRLRFTRKNGFALADGTRVSVWVDRNAPGMMSDRLPPDMESGESPDGELFKTLKDNAIVKNALQRNLNDTPLDSQFIVRDVLPEIVAIAKRHRKDDARSCLVDLRYRVIAAWDSPWQRGPKLSVAVIGNLVGVRPGRQTTVYAQPDPVECARVSSHDRERHPIVIDLFAPRVLGAGNGVSSVGYVTSEADWRAIYREHAGERCIKYRDFDLPMALLAAIDAFRKSPGLSPYDACPDTYLVNVPDWRRYPQPGWHPDRP